MAEPLLDEEATIVEFKTDLMSEDHKKQLQQQLWNIANTLRGKMNADEFRDYILGFIFYKYLSEKMHLYANKILKQDGITYEQINEEDEEGQAILEAVREESIEQLGYFLKPSELFHTLASRGNGSFVAIVDDDVVPTCKQARRHVGAHLPQTDHGEFHGCVLFRLILRYQGNNTGRSVMLERCICQPDNDAAEAAA